MFIKLVIDKHKKHAGRWSRVYRRRMLLPGPSLCLRVAAAEPFAAGEQHALDFNGLRDFLSSLDPSRCDPPTELEVIAVMIMTVCNMHCFSSSFVDDDLTSTTMIVRHRASNFRK